MKNLISTFFQILLMLMLGHSCTYENLETTCVEKDLERYQMKPYQGEYTGGCRTHLMQFKWKNEFYFDWNNHCVDRIFIMPTDCNGINLASSSSDPILNTFDQEAEFISIVGIQ